MTLQWEKVHVFISSTFNDMHAERDFLVKSVFPELAEWCEDRKMRLVDIDLRWGVTEQDATENKNVLKVCLERIDDCRPFFLCFLGQRRGWVPGQKDVSEGTLQTYPSLKDYLGQASITEMEILHALINPFQQRIEASLKDQTEASRPAEHTFFYLREPDYLEQLPADIPELLQIYTNSPDEPTAVKLAAQAQADKKLSDWREKLIPSQGRPVRKYTCTWDPNARSPELASKANALNAELTSGRLVDFRLAEDDQLARPLDRVILEDLKAAIAAQFPDHMKITEEDELQQELDQQEQFLFASSEGFISRGDDFEALDRYVRVDSRQVFVLTAPAGMGKSTLLANWIDHHRKAVDQDRGESLHFRFIGASDQSTTVYSLLQYILRELKEIHGKLNAEIPADPKELRQAFPRLLKVAGKSQKTVIVLDALNQLQTGLRDLNWLPWELPANVKLIVSFKRGEEEADHLLEQLQANKRAILSEVQPFDDLDDRRRLVDTYLDQYLKDLDEQHLDILVNSPGAENPLYLKVVLSELRVFGVFEDLGRKIREDFGDSPVSAFQGVLHRLETDPAYTPLNPAEAVPLLFGLLAHARRGLSVDELSSIFLNELGLQDTQENKQAATGTIHHYLRQMRPFLARRDRRHDFFYESFLLAARDRYVSTGRSDDLPKRTERNWHRLLAGYFENLPLYAIQQDGRRKLPHSRKVSELAYHQAWGEMWEEIYHTLSNFNFLQAKIHIFDPWTLIEDFNEAYSKGYPHENLRLIQIALNLSSHALANDPGQLWGQLRGRLSGIDDPAINDLFQNPPSEICINPLIGLLQGPGESLLRTLSGHKYAISTIVVNKEETILATGSGEPGCPQGEVNIWDLETGRELATFNEHKSSVIDIDLSQDGSTAVSISEDGTAKVWDTQTGIERGALTGFEGKLSHARIVHPTRTGEGMIVTGSRDGIVCLWRLDGRELIATFRPHQSEISAFAISDDGHFSISGDQYGDVVICDLRQRKIQRICNGHENKISAVAVIPNGTGVITASGDRTLRLWDLPTGDCRHIFKGHTDGVSDVAVFSDGTKAISASKDGTLRLWDLKSGKGLSILKKDNHSPNKVALIKNGREAVSISWDEKFYVWDLLSGELSKELEGHVDPILRMAVLRTKNWVITGGWDQFVKIWDLDAVDIPRSKFLQKDFVGPLLPHPNGEQVISFTPSSELVLWDARTGQEEWKKAGPGKTSGHASISADGKITVAGSGVWDLKARNYLGEIQSPDESYGTVAVTPNGKFAISRDRNYLTAWDLTTLQKIKSLEGTHNSGHPHFAISASGDILMATNHAGGRCYITHISFADSGLRFRELIGFPGFINDVKVTADEKLIVTASGPDIILWDFNRHKKVATLHGHKDRIHGLDTTPDGKYIVSGSMDGEVKIWNLESRKNVHTISAHEQIIRNVRMMPDGTHFVTSGGSEIAVWNIQTSERIAGFNCNGEVNTLSVVPGNNLILAREGSGQMYVLEILGFDNDKPLEEEPIHAQEQQTSIKTRSGAISVGQDTASDKAVQTLRDQKTVIEPVAETPEIRRLKERAQAGDTIAQYELADHYTKGTKTAQDPARAAEWFRKAAEGGHNVAKARLGDCYAQGKGVPQDLEEAAAWYRKAAESGYVVAQTALGDCYTSGKGVQQDLAEAAAWYRKAAEKGYVVAQMRLGDCYASGEGVPEDHAEAAVWYRKAAEDDFTVAQARLGDWYAEGKGVPKDLTEAAAWYRRAAENGYVVAQTALGDCYADGKGVAQDRARAVEWYQKAAKAGYSPAKRRLDDLKSQDAGG